MKIKTILLTIVFAIGCGLTIHAQTFTLQGRVSDKDNNPIELASVYVTEQGKLIGIITDGDLRRMLLKHANIEHVKAKEIMTPNPKTINENDLVADALHKMRNNSITQLPVLRNGTYVGVIHLHDILKEGVL